MVEPGNLFHIIALEAPVMLHSLASCKDDDLHLKCKVVLARDTLSTFYNALSEIKKLSIMLEVEF